ncbi:MAG TPA: hypothetical protein EYG18_06290 [Micavibrio sp.]|nr:hypothetical protein [Micavibrio sp.]HIL28859.1 hypothetical protein [Micavibrio sp.]
MRQSFLCVCSILALSAAAGCTTNVSGGEAAPKMTFNYVEPLTLSVGSKVIDDRHMPAADDASDDLPTPPSLALRRYAENRLKSAGGSDTLYFVIEEANVTKVTEQPEGKVMKWVGVNNSDKYSMSVVVRLYMQDANGSQSNHSLLNFNRSVTIPHHYTLAEKELEKLKFMENFMKDVDGAVENTVRTRGWLASGAYGAAPVQL